MFFSTHFRIIKLYHILSVQNRFQTGFLPIHESSLLPRAWRITAEMIIMSLWLLAAPGNPCRGQHPAPRSPLCCYLFPFTASLTHITSGHDSSPPLSVSAAYWSGCSGLHSVCNCVSNLLNVLDLVKKWGERYLFKGPNWKPASMVVGVV